jgi:DNA-binding CsgD family transcriptional regulator
MAEATGPTVRLSGREAQILALIAQGHTNKSASDVLFVSRRTVEFHLANSYKKLGVSNRIQAILAASRLGLIPTEPAFDANRGLDTGLLRELVSDCPEQRLVRREAVGNFVLQQSKGGTS